MTFYIILFYIFVHVNFVLGEFQGISTKFPNRIQEIRNKNLLLNSTEDVQCGDPLSNLSVANQVYSTGSSPAATNFGLSIIIKCRDGYNYSDGSATKSISCNADGTWDPLFACLSGLILI